MLDIKGEPTCPEILLWEEQIGEKHLARNPALEM